ncbi:unnamed protein product [Rhodiola kirilowii]
MFFHDGLVHRRFPVGPIADVPYLRKVVAAHHLHHTEKLNGVTYGLFLGPRELEEVGGRRNCKKRLKGGSSCRRQSEGIMVQTFMLSLRLKVQTQFLICTPLLQHPMGRWLPGEILVLSFLSRRFHFCRKK